MLAAQSFEGLLRSAGARTSCKPVLAKPVRPADGSDFKSAWANAAIAVLGLALGENAPVQ
jgi:hypothetical protein